MLKIHSIVYKDHYHLLDYIPTNPSTLSCYATRECFMASCGIECVPCTVMQYHNISLLDLIIVTRFIPNRMYKFVALTNVLKLY